MTFRGALFSISELGDWVAEGVSKPHPGHFDTSGPGLPRRVLYRIWPETQ
ncbi:MAG: hypothetical protein LWX56_02555 [Ignavibacteria bacterium]|nr:hypothetical protein [Ignavibacteria bacterium]